MVSATIDGALLLCIVQYAIPSGSSLPRFPDCCLNGITAATCSHWEFKLQGIDADFVRRNTSTLCSTDL